MILQAARLQFYFTTYTRKDKYRSRHSIQKRSKGH